jgi:hypothetical protein
MPMGDGIRRNVATISQEERNRLRDAFIDLHNRFYPGTKNDIPPGDVSYWFKQDEFPLAGEVVALALGAILDGKDEQLEQLRQIQAGGNLRSRK